MHGTSVLHVHGSGIHLKDIAWRRSEDKKGGCDRSHGFDPHLLVVTFFVSRGFETSCFKATLPGGLI